MTSKSKIAKELQIYIEQESKIDNFSGAVLLARGKHILFEYSSGFANKEKQIPNTVKTKFNLGSLNKMFTAVAIAQLVEKKLLRFNDPVGRYLPEYPNDGIKKRVTIHHLLTHTSGLGHYIKNWDKYQNIREKIKTINDFVNLFQNDPLFFGPGEKYQYSGNGYELLGLIIENVTQQNYYDYVVKNVFQKANMLNSGFYEVNNENLQPDIAIGYEKTKESFFTPLKEPLKNNLETNLIKGSAAGGAYSTVHDLLNFPQALLEKKLLNSKMTNLVITPKIKIETIKNQTLLYAYGFQVVDFNGRYTRIGHGGAFAGVNARLDIYKEPRFILIVLSNYDRPTAFRIAVKAERLIVAD